MPSPLSFRHIPAIEQLRQRPEAAALERRYGRAALVEALRAEADVLRQRLAGAEGAAHGAAASLPASPDAAADSILAATATRLSSTYRPSLRRVINATGVVVHTNLGRVPLAESALEHLRLVARGYSTLEYDLEAGARGRRDVHAEALLTRLTGAEAAVVVNNNAAATLLLLMALARGREVLISRGELVEIGGGFRVPEIMAQSGAILREVGTTNRTRASDYAAALNERTALILRVHPSNFRIEGFTERPAVAELAAMARRHGVPLAEDLGSGYLGRGLDAAAGVLRDEPAVGASLEAGVDILCFSGDKLLGGPQAGIIVGRAALVTAVRQHPLMRALRADKMTYAALEGTLLAWLGGRASEELPLARMLAMPAEQIAARAARVRDQLRDVPGLHVSIARGSSVVGGGSAPGMELPTSLLVVERDGMGADDLEARLRRLPTPIIARIDNDRVVLDLRTVRGEEEAEIVEMIKSI